MGRHTRFVAALCLIASPVAAQVGTGPDASEVPPVLTWKGPPPCWSGAGECPGMPKGGSYVGEVVCVDGVPTPTVREDADYRRAVSREETVRHETAHVAQLLTSCDSTLALWARDPVARLEAEVEATCIGIRQLDPATKARRRNEARFALLLLYGQRVGPATVIAAFDRCDE